MMDQVSARIRRATQESRRLHTAESGGGYHDLGAGDG